LLQSFALFCAQIISFIFVIHGEQPKLIATEPPVVNYAQAATFAFTAPRIRLAQLSQTTSTFDHIACFWIGAQLLLKLPKSLISHVVLPNTLERREFYEAGLHD
jgi:hypothetical protein